MAGYTGRQDIYGAFEKQVFTPDGTTNIFQLDFKVGSATSLLVFDNGVALQPGAGGGFTIGSGGKTIVFASPPQVGHTVFALYLGLQTTVPRTAGNEPYYQHESAGAGQQQITVTSGPVDETSVIMFVDKVLQRPTTDYTVNGSTINLTNPLAGGEDIDIFVQGIELSGIYTVNNSRVNLTWSSWVPNISSPDAMTLSNLVVTKAEYMKTGDIVRYALNFSVQCSGTFGYRIRASLPHYHAADIPGDICRVTTAGGAVYVGHVIPNVVSSFDIYLQSPSSAAYLPYFAESFTVEITSFYSAA